LLFIAFKIRLAAFFRFFISIVVILSQVAARANYVYVAFGDRTNTAP